ncbi:MAG: prepilin-type N-terminal cleavage/methylation domain-containing protein [Proteobacteria bacterium]|nr:prepilin-type N-terminal cleavage/methylation domain-containing protein [Pseudomonadota bacterium]MBU1711060.1 prepilin-type N-terminal cleavage/methylation domain-containing protein [Pseudomonadota bacterium]
MSQKSRNKGFTLLELVIVMIILGILSAVAIPHYLDMQKEAKFAVTKGKISAIRGGIELAHAKILVSGVNTGPEGDNPDWPTLEEVQFNELRLSTRPVSLHNLKLVRTDHYSTEQNKTLPPCILPDMTSAMSQNSSAVAYKSLADIQTEIRRGDESTCWAYYPGNERNADGRVVGALFYLNDDRSFTDNIDAAGKRPSQW